VIDDHDLPFFIAECAGFFGPGWLGCFDVLVGLSVARIVSVQQW
jgi:hypothetical protein